MNTFKDQELISRSAGDQLPSFRHPHGPSKGLKGLSAPRHCQGSPNSRRHPRLRSTSIRSTSAHQHGLTSKEKALLQRRAAAARRFTPASIWSVSPASVSPSSSRRLSSVPRATVPNHRPYVASAADVDETSDCSGASIFFTRMRFDDDDGLSYLSCFYFFAFFSNQSFQTQISVFVIKLF